MNNLLVMKFGGTSVGSAERMRVAARISADLRKERPVAIVVSAMSRITDLLLDTMLESGPDRLLDVLQKMPRVGSIRTPDSIVRPSPLIW